MGVFFMRGYKVLWSGSRLITLSPWPCCRGGVRACVVCVYLDIVTWTCWKVTITIRLPYLRYTIEPNRAIVYTAPPYQTRNTYTTKTRQRPPPHNSGMRATKSHVRKRRAAWHAQVSSSHGSAHGAQDGTAGDPS